MISKLRVLLFFIFISRLDDVQSKDPCEFRAFVSRYANIEGFHCELHTVIEITTEQPYLWNNCSVLIEENLPASLYVNPDELADLRRFRKLEACPEGFIDIELPAHKATPVKVHVYSELMKADNLLISTITRMPFHARYHAPVPGGGYVTVEYPRPSIFVHCQHLTHHCLSKTTKQLSCTPCSTEECLWHQISYDLQAEPIIVEIPVGNTDLLPIVQFITIFSTCVGCLYLIFCVLCKSHKEQLNHQKKS